MIEHTNKTPSEVEKDLKTDIRKGLTQQEALLRLQKYGENTISETKQRSLIILFLKQFQSILVYVLVAAAVISFLTEHFIDAALIIAIIIFNSIFSFIQEYRAEKAISALKNLVQPNAKVIRDGQVKIVNARSLVIGDIIRIEEGDKIPADCRIVNAVNLRTVESALTGESVPIDKNVLKSQTVKSIGDATNMLWKGTLCVSGACTAIVIATGDKTQIGLIAESIQSIEEGKTHFQIVTDRLTKQMGVIALIGAGLIFLIGTFVRTIPFEEIFLFSIASLVSAIPEGLPAVLTIVLAIGAYRMSKRNAILRNLSASETLSVVDVIATDKTGTLTQNTMSIQSIVLADNSRVEVTGSGWEMEGNFTAAGKEIEVGGNEELFNLVKAGFLCNAASVVYQDGKFEVIGDPTEASLFVLGKKAGLDVVEKEKVIFDEPFTAERKWRASIVNWDEKHNAICVVGASEEVEKLSTKFMQNGKEKNLSEAVLNQLEKSRKDLSENALRVLGIAVKLVPKTVQKFSAEQATDMQFLGFVGMKDPARPEVYKALQQAKTAGIKVMMLTGDHKETAVAIAKDIGLIDDGEDVSKIAYTQVELEDLDEENFGKAISDGKVFSRLTPEMKLVIAKTLQMQGHTVAMTGDGVNDAPALKQADIGISMGIVGTDTAREASEMVLADDNFASIVQAVEEGRIVFTNVRRSSTFLVTTNIAEQLTILTTLIAGFPLPLLPTQILWLNLITDGICDVALATERGHGRALLQPPRKKEEGILTKRVFWFTLIMSLIMLIVTFLFFVDFLQIGLDKARTVAFLVMSFTQLFNAFNVRSFTRSIFEIGFLSNKFVLGAFAIGVLLNYMVVNLPFFHTILGFTFVSMETFLLIFAVSSSVLWVGEIVKLIDRIKTKV